MGDRTKHQMREPGQRLRQARERLRLRYRDVEEASQWIANQHSNHEFLVGLSRLADIENKGTMPSLYRLYSLCAIYRLDYTTALSWYGIELGQLPVDAGHFGAQQTQPFDMQASERDDVTIPTAFQSSVDFTETGHLSRVVQTWGKLPISLLGGLELRKNRYAFIGTDDWFMFPIIPPGSFVQLDERKKKIARSGWISEYERPIYFLEHRAGFKCGWCSQNSKHLIVLPHSTSEESPVLYEFPGEVEVIGQVVGIVMRLDQARKRHTHS